MHRAVSRSLALSSAAGATVSVAGAFTYIYQRGYSLAAYGLENLPRELLVFVIVTALCFLGSVLGAAVAKSRERHLPLTAAVVAGVTLGLAGLAAGFFSERLASSSYIFDDHGLGDVRVLFLAFSIAWVVVSFCVTYAVAKRDAASAPNTSLERARER